MMAALTVLSVSFYLVAWAGGWVLCFASRWSRRYYPALTLAGIAIGLLPTYALLRRALIATGRARDAPDVWQMATLCLTLAATAACVLLATFHVIRERGRAWPR